MQLSPATPVTAKMKYLLIASAAIALLPSAAFADDAAPADGHRVRVGLGAKIEPEYIGADSTQVGPLFKLNIARGSNQFKFSAPDDGPSIAVVSSNGFSFGPAFNIASKRKESDVGAPVRKAHASLGLAAVFSVQS